MDLEIAKILLGFVSNELLIMVGVVFVLGMIIKKIPSILDWMIPIILTVVGVAMSICYLAIVVGMGFTSVCIMTGVVQGIIVSGLAVYANQIIKQIVVKKPVDKYFANNDKEV